MPLLPPLLPLLLSLPSVPVEPGVCEVPSEVLPPLLPTPVLKPSVPVPVPSVPCEPSFPVPVVPEVPEPVPGVTLAPLPTVELSGRLGTTIVLVSPFSVLAISLLSKLRKNSYAAVPGSATILSLEHPSKAVGSIYVTDGGITISARLTQFSKAFASINSTL